MEMRLRLHELLKIYSFRSFPKKHKQRPENAAAICKHLRFIFPSSSLLRVPKLSVAPFLLRRPPPGPLLSPSPEQISLEVCFLMEFFPFFLAKCLIFEGPCLSSI